MSTTKKTKEEAELRDRIAASVAGAPNSHRPANLWQWTRWAAGLPYKGCRSDYNQLARSAYDMADAMLAARNQSTK